MWLAKLVKLVLLPGLVAESKVEGSSNGEGLVEGSRREGATLQWGVFILEVGLVIFYHLP